MEAHFPNITNIFERDRTSAAARTTCPPIADNERSTSEVRERPPTLIDNNQIEITNRNNKVSRSPGEHTLSLSHATKHNLSHTFLILTTLVTTLFWGFL